MSTGRLPSVDGGIQPTIVDAKGDLIVATAADTVSRLAVGSNDQVLTADSTTATGLKWATAATPSTAKNYSLLNAGGTTLSGTTTTISGISGKDDLLILVTQAAGLNASTAVEIRINSVSANYFAVGSVITAASTYATGNFVGNSWDGFSGINIGAGASSSPSIDGSVRISGCNTTGLKVWTCIGAGRNSGGNGQQMRFTQGSVSEAATVSSISVVSQAGSFTSGTVYVYGAA